MTTQFSESDWDSFVNDNSLDLEEEEEFQVFLMTKGSSSDATLDELAELYAEFQESKGFR